MKLGTKKDMSNQTRAVVLSRFGIIFGIAFGIFFLTIFCGDFNLSAYALPPMAQQPKKPRVFTCKLQPISEAGNKHCAVTNAIKCSVKSAKIANETRNVLKCLWDAVNKTCTTAYSTKPTSDCTAAKPAKKAVGAKCIDSKNRKPVPNCQADEVFN